MPPIFLLIGQSNMVHMQDILEAQLRIYYPDCLALKMAVGGDDILSWRAGMPNHINAVNATLEKIEQGHVPAAILCSHGETDAKYPETAGNYRAQFWEAMRTMRSEIGFPNLPVIYTKLGEPPLMPELFPAWSTISSQEEAITENHPAFVKVSSWGCGQYEDARPWCHRDVPGLTMLAKRLVTWAMTKVPI